MKVLCECNSFDCNESIDLSLEENKKVHSDCKNIIIANSCPFGADPTDVFVKKGNGYSVYKEA